MANLRGKKLSDPQAVVSCNLRDVPRPIWTAVRTLAQERGTSIKHIVIEALRQYTQRG